MVVLLQTHILTTDASEVDLGAVLSTQRGITIGFTSRVLSPTETKYCTTEKECVDSQEVPPLSIWSKVTLKTDYQVPIATFKVVRLCKKAMPILNI